MLRFLSILLITSIAANAYAEPELKGSPTELQAFLIPESKTVTLTGSHEMTVYSDTATVNLLVTSEEDTLGQALEKNGKIRKILVEQLLNIGVSKEAIKNAKFSSSPEYGWFGKEPDHYKVMNRLSVKVSEEESLRAIALIADKIDAVKISGTDFEDSKKEEHKKLTKKRALERVLEDKAFYENTLSVKLTPISFYDGIVHINPTTGASQIEEVALYSMRADKSLKRQSIEPPSKSSFDELNYHASIRVEFKVTP